MREVYISCSILLRMSNFCKWYERQVTFLKSYRRALLWLPLSLPPLQAPLRPVVPKLSGPNPSFYKCSPDRGELTPKITRSQRQSWEWNLGVLSTHPSYAASLLCLLESIATPLEGSFHPCGNHSLPSPHRILIQEGSSSSVC